MIGKTISHYKILEKLGEGGMGVVYKAEDTKLGRTVALKFLPPDLTRDPEAKERFIREARAASALDHPNICTIHEFNEIEGKSFITMAFVDGPSLEDEIESGPMKIDRAIELSIQIAKGLQAAHEKGIVHRDIKTGNILLTSKGQVKIADFGLAKLPGRTKLTKTGSTVGTIAYMSPEQARGEEVDHRSDIWSLGVILYEMLSGRRPFKGYHEQAVAYSILNEEPVSIRRHRPDVPEGLEAIISRTLQKKPENRYKSAADLLSDLKKLQKAQEPGVTIPSHGRSVILKWGIPTALLLLIVFASLLFMKHRSMPGRTIRIKLAVVDFDVLSGEGAEYLAGGLAEGISVKLSKLQKIGVVSGDDVRRLRKEKQSAREVAKKLGAQFALSGTLLKSGGRIRVTPQLIKASTGEVVWSGLFDRTFSDVFGFLDEVSLKIADALKIELDPQDRNAILQNPTESTEAYRHYLKGRHHYYSETPKDNERAAVEFQKALRMDPKYPPAMAGLADVYLQRYREEYDYDEYWLDEAERLIERALRLDPRLAEGYKSLAGILMIKEDFPKAIKAAEKAVEIRSDWDDPYILLGNVYERRGELGKALDKYEHALTIRSSAGALCGKGRIYAAFGKMDSAQAAYRAAMKVNPYNERPYIQLGEMYEKQQQLQKAEELFRKAIEIRPDRSWAYRDLVDLLSSDRYDELEKMLRGYVDKYPYKWGGYEVLFDFLAWYKGDYEAAVETVEEAVVRNPERVWPHLFMAATYAFRMRHTAEPAKALQAVKEALKLRPDSGKVLGWVSFIYCGLDSIELGLRYYKQALEKSPSSLDLIFALIQEYSSHGRYEEAIDVAERGMEQLPGRYEIYLLLGYAMANVDRLPEYMDLLEKAVSEHSENPDLWDILSMMQCINGRYDGAVESARRAQNGTNRNYLRLGTALWLSGRSEEALAVFQKAPLEFYRAFWAIAVWKYQKRLKRIESFLDELKRGAIPGSTFDMWVWAAPSYYASMRHFDEAVAALEEALRSNKVIWAYDLNLFLVECYRLKGDLSKAERLLDEIKASLPLDYEAAAEWQYADIAALRGRREKAVKHAQKALAVSRGSFSRGHGQVKLAKLLYAAGQKEQAAHILTPITGSSFYNSFRPYYRKGQIGTAADKDGTAKYLRRALLAATFASRGGTKNIAGVNLAVARTFCAMAAARLGDPERARSEIEYALRLEPEMAEVAYNAACAYNLMGDTGAALTWLRTAVERGWQELWWARVDPDLDSLRKLPQFKKIMSDWDRRLHSITG